MNSDVEKQSKIAELEQLLVEAMELLEDNRLMLSLFNKQYYYKLKAKVDKHRRFN